MHCVHKAIYCEFASIRSTSSHTYFWCLFLAESLPDIIAETPSSNQEASQEDTGGQGERSLEEVFDLM